MTRGVRLLIVCEGQTEANFVSHCLTPTLAQQNVWAHPSLLKTKPGQQGGGDVTLPRIGKHLANEFPNWDYLTTLVDLYGFSDRQNRSQPELEEAIRNEAIRHRPELVSARIIPYVQQYEFEALLFSDVRHFEWVLDGWTQKTERELQAIANDYETPEHINDHPSTAPSKRLGKVFGGIYRKTEHGPIIAEEIGIEVIRSSCPGFDRWISQLEKLADSSSTQM